MSSESSLQALAHHSLHAQKDTRSKICSASNRSSLTKGSHQDNPLRKALLVIPLSFFITLWTAKPAMARCEATGYSWESNQPASITIANRRWRPIRLIWVDFNRKRRFYRSIAPGRSYRQPSYSRHLWLIEEEGTGRCLSRIRLNAPMRVTIKMDE